MADFEKSKKSFKYNALQLLLILLVSYLAGAILALLFAKQTINIFSNLYILTSGETFLYAFLVFLVIGIVFLTNFMKNIGKFSSSSDNQYFDSHFIPLNELRKNKKYNFSKFTDLSNKKDGIVIRSELIGNNIEVNMYDPIHTMIIGSTGSGKTTRYVNPTIQILSHCATKPSMVISDPKGELYDLHAKMLSDQGYDIKVLDLRNPYASARWNPLSRAYNLYHRALSLEKEVVVRKGINPADLKLKITAKEYGTEWWEFNGYAFATQSALKNEIDAFRKELIGEALNELSDICNVLCPITNKTDSTWERVAKEFINAILIAMLEDTADPKLNLGLDKYTFYNVSKIANLRNNNPNAKLFTLQKYFECRAKTSNAKELANAVVNNSPKTADNYLGFVTNYLNLFTKDPSMSYLTSATEIDFKTIADKPTALFIKIPDEIVTRHPIASIAISQLYKSLVEVAARRGGALPRNVHFILDEFANLPKIEDISTIITVARSRKMFFHLVIQSYPQLANKYDETVAETLRSNCNIHIYIGTTDQKTKEEFSKRCGDKSIKTHSTTENKGGGSGDSSKSKSTQTSTRPLVYPNELEHLGENTYIVSIMNEFPMKVKYTPSYLCKKPGLFDLSPMPEKFVPKKYFDEEKIFYDINFRNKLYGFPNPDEQDNNFF